MKLSDVIERKKVRTRKGEPEQFTTALKGSGREGVLVSACGETQEEADAALLERIRDRFRGSYDPLYLRFRGSTVLIWRDGDEWVYGHIHEKHYPEGVHLGGWTSRDEVERVARRHLAQMGWDGQEETSDIMKDQEDQEEFSRWASVQKQFLKRWRILREVGWNEQEARYILDGFFHLLDPARVQALGDPQQLLAGAEKIPQQPLQAQ
jgi:hypothetical protein